MYVYRYSREDRIYTVGYYDPAGDWHAESDWVDKEAAAARVARLNGGGPGWDLTQLRKVWTVNAAADMPLPTIALHLLCAMCANGDHDQKAPATLARDALDLAAWFLRVAQEPGPVRSL